MNQEKNISKILILDMLYLPNLFKQFTYLGVYINIKLKIGIFIGILY